MGMREEFEAVYEPPVGCQLDTRNNEWYQAWDELSGDPERDQEISEYNNKWCVWQASRAALVIQLPYVSVIFEGADQDNYMVEACREAIHAVGVRTK